MCITSMCKSFIINLQRTPQKQQVSKHKPSNSGCVHQKLEIIWQTPLAAQKCDIISN